MSLFGQPLLYALEDEMIVDLFAGGGGASSGIEQALGRPVDVAINHDAAAVELHRANHPQTLHYRADVFEVDPREVTKGRQVGVLWASPDCTFHSKARGAKPIRHASKKRRALAWVVKRWAGQVAPRVILMENVEEFTQWGPLVGDKDALRPCPKRRGKTFRKFVRDLEALGYVVEWRELRACDFGAPTIRKRWFCVARRDGRPIVWPEPAHGAPDSLGVKAGKLKPYRTAAECIDWSYPMCSIFATKAEAKAWGVAHGQAAPVRPLAENTLRRIARGVDRYVLRNPKPYLVTLNHGGSWQRAWDLGDPFKTVTSARDAHAVVAPVVSNVANGKTTGRGPNAWSPDEPLRTSTSSGGFALAAPVMVKSNHGDKPDYSVEEPTRTIVAGGTHHAVVAPILSGVGGRAGQSPERSVEAPYQTITAKGDAAVVAAHVTKFRTGSTGQDLDEPMGTVTANSSDAARPGGAAPIGVVAAHLSTYYGGPGGDSRGVDPNEPLRVQGTENRFGVVASFLAQNNEGGYTGPGRDLLDPNPTVCAHGSLQSLVGVALTKQRGTSTDADPQDPLDTVSAGGTHHGIAAAHLQRDFGNSVGHAADEPIGTVTGAGGGKAALVASFLSTYYSTGDGQAVSDPLRTIPTLDNFGLVTVRIGEETFVVSDIAMRMLQPKELYAAQGFRPGYVYDHYLDPAGKRVDLTKTEQVRMVGNSVCPPVAQAIVLANVPEMVARPKREMRKGVGLAA